MKAILLAAGRGSRLGDTDLPKPLWEIGPRSPSDSRQVAIVERQVELLHEVGVSEVLVIVGFRQELVRERLAHANVTFVENTHPNIAVSGTAHSFQFAAYSESDPLGGREPCLLLDADLAYERRVLREIVAADGASAAGAATTATAASEERSSRLLVTPVFAGDDEEVRVYGDATGPRLIGKRLRPPLTNGLSLLGEATGIIRFEPQDHAVVRAALDWLVGHPTGDGPRGSNGFDTEHEQLSQFLLSLGLYSAQTLSEGLLFAEADFPEDFARVRSTLYPAILERDAATTGERDSSA